MSCWKCTCGTKNCDTDTCTNPGCKCKDTVPIEPHRCFVCGMMTVDYIVSLNGVVKPFCTHCKDDGTFDKFFANEFSFKEVQHAVANQ
jgi:hypothetical protein